MASTNSRIPSPSVQTRWSSLWQLLAQSRLWFFLLIAIGTFSSVIYPHPPLVAFGAIAGGTLKVSPNGIVPRQERPEILKKGILARIPPLLNHTS